MKIRWLVALATIVGLTAFAPVAVEAHGPSYRGGAVVHGRPAFAPVRHGGHWRPRVGVYIGAPIVAAPFWYHGYYGPSYHYYSPPPVYYYSAPQYTPEYIEREAPAPQNWWYYCGQSQAYYPYVKECPGGWRRVAPQPPISQ